MGRIFKSINILIIITVMCSSLVFVNLNEEKIQYDNTFGGDFQPSSSNTDEYEENDEMATATDSSIVNSYRIITNDPDWFKFSLNTNENLSIMIESNNTAAVEVNLYTNDGITSVGTITVGTKQIHAYLMAVALSGIYYLRLIPKSECTENFISINELTAIFADDENENDDNPTTDTIRYLDEGTSISLMALDEDWFLFGLSQDKKYQIEVVYNNYGDLDIDFFNHSDYTAVAVPAYELITNYPSGEHFGKRFTLNPTFNDYLYLKIDPIAITSYQIIYRIFGDPLITPYLELTSYDTKLGIATLSWNADWEVLDYLIFRSTSEIVDVSSMEPYAISRLSPFEEFVQPNGIYYYAIVATDYVVNSTLSNCVSQTIDVQPLTTPTLILGSPTPTETAEIEITWNPQPSMHCAYIYRSNSSFNSIENMQYIDCVHYSIPSFFDYITTNGSYYYGIIFSNPIENSTLSNIIRVDTNFPKPGKPILDPINANYGKGKYIQLDFSAGTDTSQLYIYKSNSPINSTTIHNLNAIQIVDATRKIYLDEITANGTYYYTLIGHNIFGLKSEMANIQSITVEITLDTNYTIEGVKLGLYELEGLPNLTLVSSAMYSMNLPFNFPFYGVLMDRLYISQNGMVKFLGGSTYLLSATIPSTNQVLCTSILPFFHEISELAISNTTIYNGTDVVVIQWEESDETIGEYLLYQLILYVNGTFEFRYSDTMAFLDIPKVGINYGDGVHYNSTGLIPDNSTGLKDIRFTPYSTRPTNTQNSSNTQIDENFNPSNNSTNPNNTNNSQTNSTESSSNNTGSSPFSINGYLVETIGVIFLATSSIIIKYQRKSRKNV